ncbi:hypothetical protein VCV18_006458 [Metarhizium anisopliae]
MLKVLEHILLTWPALEPEYRAYNDAIKDLQSESMIELQRLAAEMPDHLLTKIQKLAEFVEPVKAQWQSEPIRTSLKSYADFCQYLGLDKAQKYLASRRAHELKDWGSCELDSEGLLLQNELEERLKASYALWQQGFSNILADLLEYLNWVELPTEMRSMVERVLSDRFWQAGISEGSKDDFYARVMDKKNTIEGLASTIRGSFYGFSGLSGPLSEALFSDSIWLSTHQQSNLLNLVRYLVDDCPVDYREQFLPQLLAACFRQMDAKVNGEWERMEKQQTCVVDGEAGLKEEMKAESILRQVTYTAVMMVADFLDPTKSNSHTLKSRSRKEGLEDEPSRPYPSLRKFCLMRQEIVEPLLVFCTHGIRMRDTRCCGMVLRLFISLVPEFQLVQGQEQYGSTGNVHDGKAGSSHTDATPVPAEIASVIREYIAQDVLKACLTSFHEPYFVEVQKELASLIATIVVYYSPITATPKDIILSLPNVNPAELDRLAPYMSKPASHPRQQRAIVLELLKDLKGVSVSEMGKLAKTAGFGGSSRNKRGNRSKMAQGFMNAPTEADGRVTRGNGVIGARRTTPDALEGVSNLFEG